MIKLLFLVVAIWCALAHVRAAEYVQVPGQGKMELWMLLVETDVPSEANSTATPAPSPTWTSAQPWKYAHCSSDFTSVNSPCLMLSSDPSSYPAAAQWRRRPRGRYDPATAHPSVQDHGIAAVKQRPVIRR